MLKTEGNLNNQIGVPMTISRIEPEHEAAVVEMGISGFGEMRCLAKMVRPTIGVFTVIGHAHLEQLHDLEGVFRAKTEMLEEMDARTRRSSSTGTTTCCGPELPPEEIRFGLGEDCDVRAERSSRLGERGTRCTIVGCGGASRSRSRPTANTWSMPRSRARRWASCLGLTDAEIAAGVASYETVGRRGAVSDTGSLTLIDDCYNANPDSVKCGIDSLLDLSGRRVCILGDMLELGENAAQMHYELGRYAREQGVDAGLCLWGHGREIAAGAGESGRHFESRDALIAALPTLLRRGDRVLVKASRGMRFELIAEAVKSLGEKT